MNGQMCPTASWMLREVSLSTGSGGGTYLGGQSVQQHYCWAEPSEAKVGIHCREPGSCCWLAREEGPEVLVLPAMQDIW